MAESIKQHLNAARIDKVTNHELLQLLNAVLADLTAVRTSITTITAKLDLDAGVTDTNYAALGNPAALTTTA